MTVKRTTLPYLSPRVSRLPQKKWK